MVEVVGLPSLLILGQPVRTHTQGSELAAGHFYVTARRDDIRHGRALLLRTTSGMTEREGRDITPTNSQNAGAVQDHSGGFQSDVKRLWIPPAESRKNGWRVVRVFALAEIISGQPLRSEFEFRVHDHIGALAVDAGRGRVLGPSWDTGTVYVWDLDGQSQRTLTGAALSRNHLVEPRRQHRLNTDKEDAMPEYRAGNSRSK